MLLARSMYYAVDPPAEVWKIETARTSVLREGRLEPPANEFLVASATDPATEESQSKDIAFLLSMGELFTLVAYGQLIIEYRNLQPGDVSDDLLDQIFDFMVRDFSKFALEIHQKHNATESQMAICRRMIRTPVVNQERFTRIFDEHVFALKGAYQMND